MPTSITTAPGFTCSRPIILRPADGDDENVRLRAVIAARSDVREWQIVTVACSCKQQHGYRLADDIAAADDDGMLARDVDARPLDQLDDARRRARQQAVVADDQVAYADRMKAVHVLCRGIASMTAFSSICFGSGSCTRMPWMRFVAGETFDQLQEFFLRDVGSGKRWTSEYMPTSWHAFSLLRT